MDTGSKEAPDRARQKRTSSWAGKGAVRAAENYELPQPWAQRAMYWATYAVLAQVLLVIAV